LRKSWRMYRGVHIGGYTSEMGKSITEDIAWKYVYPMCTPKIDIGEGGYT